MFQPFMPYFTPRNIFAGSAIAFMTLTAINVATVRRSAQVAAQSAGHRFVSIERSGGGL